MPAITKSGNILTKKLTKIEETNSVGFEYVINETTLLNKLKTVDGKGSGLDADLVRGDYINPRMFKNRIINGNFSVWQRGEDFLFGTPDSWAAATQYNTNDIRIPTTANGYYYECITPGISGSTEPTWPTNVGGTVTDNNVETWAGSTTYTEGDIRIPTSPNGYTYECTTAGTSGSSEPTWPTNPGDTVTDGDVVWTCRAQAEWVCKGVHCGGNGYYTADRIVPQNPNNNGIFIVNKSEINGNNSIKFIVKYPATSEFTENDFWRAIEYRCEGYTVRDLKDKHITISFLFKSDVTGKFSVAVRSGTGSKSYVTTFNYDQSEEVKKIEKTIFIPQEVITSTTINNGLNVDIGFLNQGNIATSTTDQWIDGNYLTTPDCVNWAAQAGNYIEIAELQLEEGEVATEFEHVPYDIQLMRCMRYYEVIGLNIDGVASGSDPYSYTVNFVEKRIVPSVKMNIRTQTNVSLVVFQLGIQNNTPKKTGRYIANTLGSGRFNAHSNVILDAEL